MGTSLRRMSRAEPASWLLAHTCRLKDPRWTALRRRVRFTWDGRLILRGDRSGIHRLKLTGAAILVSRGMKVLQAAPAAYPYRSAALKGRCSMRCMIALGLALVLPGLAGAGDLEETLRFYLAKSDVVVLGEFTSDPIHKTNKFTS